MPATMLQLDFAADSPLEALEAIAALLAAAPGLAIELLEAEGPSGWPLLAFMVPNAHLQAFKAAYGLED